MAKFYNQDRTFHVTIQVDVVACSEDEALLRGEDLIKSIDMQELQQRTDCECLQDIYMDGTFDVYVDEAEEEFDLSKFSPAQLANENMYLR